MTKKINLSVPNTESNNQVCPFEQLEQGRAVLPENPKVVALIPAFNEEERITATINAVKGIPEVSRVVVIDDGSKDDTAQLAVDAGARVIRSTRNVGKGPVLEHAAKQHEDADIILLLDADLADTASQAKLLLAPVLKGEVDMSIARFPRPVTKAGFGLVKSLARFEIRKAGGKDEDFQAPLSGQRAVTQACLTHIRPFAKGYGVEVTLTVRALRADYRVKEIETTMAHKATGRNLRGFLHRGKQFRDVLGAVILLNLKRK
ncbi:MAG: glycosyltransferase family 2 protein [Coriobacteriia bacterium]|nr:glycosyltransferase family 2 protein [Coriobacteriia bacterium]MCL2746736.1 glycosyltransferase family 2 protein [Coriobacteriia bacterium]MCL2870148.1 glycosyltransferase family 2 protein [Coriobacteriia bacterium]